MAARHRNFTVKRCLDNATVDEGRVFHVDTAYTTELSLRRFRFPLRERPLPFLYLDVRPRPFRQRVHSNALM
jgi:hypothetical protein